MTAPYGTIVAQMLRVLASLGPMTNSELCAELKQDKEKVGAVLNRMNKASPKMPKRVYIIRYVYDADGARRYPRAVYSIGDKQNAPKPKADVNANRRRHRAKRALRVNSVFMLGTPRRIMRELSANSTFKLTC